MIQIPRLYEAYRESGAIGSFQDMLDNIFLPLFEVSTGLCGYDAVCTIALRTNACVYSVH